MTTKQWIIIVVGLCFLPVFIIIGAVMALCGNDPFRELRRIARDGR